MILVGNLIALLSMWWILSVSTPKIKRTKIWINLFSCHKRKPFFHTESTFWKFDYESQDFFQLKKQNEMLLHIWCTLYSGVYMLYRLVQIRSSSSQSLIDLPDNLIYAVQPILKHVLRDTRAKSRLISFDTCTSGVFFPTLFYNHSMLLSQFTSFIMCFFLSIKHSRKKF